MGSKAEAIEQYLLKIIALSENQTVELRRAELSSYFCCVPSQINYVLKTRFTTSQGYVVESRRGGGGYLRIVKVPLEQEDDLIKMLADGNKQNLSEQEAKGLIARLVEDEFYSKTEGRLMLGVLTGATLDRAKEQKDALRMDLMRAMVLAKLREK
ncbi:CtsR family transcriptional regulator [Clostridia bacterium]|nr:CtsR family transcriptional regulator [Clostridia bacterium]